MLAEYCPTHFDSHVSALTATLLDKCRVLMEALEANFGTAAEFTAPKGGIFIRITLPDAVDTTALAAAAVAEGVTLNPGAEWTADPASNGCGSASAAQPWNNSATGSPSWPTFATAPPVCRNAARMWSAMESDRYPSTKEENGTNKRPFPEDRRVSPLHQTSVKLRFDAMLKICSPSAALL